jgi:hypothetical protein
MLPHSRLVLTIVVAIVSFAPATIDAQWQSNTGPAGSTLGATVGSDVERYLRALSIAGIVRVLPWAARPFGPDELRTIFRDSARIAHPWQRAVTRELSARARIGAIAYANENSGFAWGSNDGPMWQGRGVTGAVGLSASVHWGPLSLVAAPVAFSAQNKPYEILPPQVPGVSPFADPLFPNTIDLPQRMGSGTYSRIDAGESTLRLRLPRLAIGLSTASLGWGIGEAFPAVLGPNAGGFPHAFVGTTDRGIRIPYLGRVSGRYALGRLDQSAWSQVHGSETFVNYNEPGTRRIGVGLSVGFIPEILPNLELGASRFYHSPYRAGGARWSTWSKPFEGVYKDSFRSRVGGPGDQSGDADNQLASLFARWVFPARGVEAAFELLREDHSWDWRDAAQEPEHNSAVLGSIRAITHRTASRLGVLTLEYFDGDVRPIAQDRPQGLLYVHTPLLQGHTERGQLLGAPIGAGAIAAERIAWEQFTAAGSTRFALQRWRPRARRNSDGRGIYVNIEQRYPDAHDWIIDGSVESTRYRHSRALTVTAGLAWAGVWQFGSSRSNFYTRASWSLF